MIDVKLSFFTPKTWCLARFGAKFSISSKEESILVIQHPRLALYFCAIKLEK